jgi:hypothetical protein
MALSVLRSINTWLLGLALVRLVPVGRLPSVPSTAACPNRSAALDARAARRDDAGMVLDLANLELETATRACRVLAWALSAC